jgi:hypothetical protein
MNRHSRTLVVAGRLFAAGAVVALAACSGSTGIAPPLRPSSDVGSGADRGVFGDALKAPGLNASKLTGEILSGTVRVACYHHHVGEFYVARFKAHGTATGPLRGTFTAHGGWEFSFKGTSGPFASHFHESFMIVSAARTVEGMMQGSGGEEPNCRSYTNQRVHYTIVGGREGGTAGVNLSGKSFNEALQ